MEALQALCVSMHAACFFSKIPAPIEISLTLPPPRKNQNTHLTLKREFYGHGGFFFAARTKIQGAHQIGKTISGPRIAGTVSESTVSNTELSEFLALAKLRGQNSVSSSQPMICVPMRTHRVFEEPTELAAEFNEFSLPKQYS